ncbi:MAG: hypothetical protein FWF25_00485 [Propionibacteriaceae bacterium]|nr:hypothetical protein [Propionibacteriaceae bacterium]
MTSKIYKARKAVIAAIASASLLMGGSTYALWAASADLGSTQIESGNLALAVGQKQMWDISSDLSNAPDRFTSSAHPLVSKLVNQAGADATGGKLLLDEADGDKSVKDPAWKTVPDDELAILAPLTINMAGDNLIARLDVTTLPPVQADAPYINGLANFMTVSYDLYDSKGNLVEKVAPSKSSTRLSLYYSTSPSPISTGETKNANVIDIPPSATDFTLCVLMTFDPIGGDPGSEGSGDLLYLRNAVKVSLTQVRG